MTLIFDIETRPMPVERLKQTLPAFDPASIGPHPGDFDPESVRYGNMTDPTKRRAKLEEAIRKHADAVEAFERKMGGAEARHWQDVYDKAALSAETGTVCAIGYRNAQGKVAIDCDLDMDEATILRRWWAKADDCAHARPQRRLVGWNSNAFDVPFLIRRSWYLGVSVPDWIFTPTGWLSPIFVCLMQRWQCGDRRSACSLDRAARACGVPGKPDDCTGAMFHAMVSEESTRKSALDYLKNDLAMTAAVAERMGVL